LIDKDILLNKADRVHRHVKRVKDKRPARLKEFLSTRDLQDIVLFNLQMAIQNCIDMASHVISDEGLGVPGSTNEMFYRLHESGYISQEVAEKMVAAVGFRNLVVHEYAKVDLEEVYKISHDHIDDLLDFLRALFMRAGLASAEPAETKTC
jgi:uncharacterized protein YutE (UPF0331/DUF86 family)